jgi:hypothetical protein
METDSSEENSPVPGKTNVSDLRVGNIYCHTRAPVFTSKITTETPLLLLKTEASGSFTRITYLNLSNNKTLKVLYTPGTLADLVLVVSG